MKYPKRRNADSDSWTVKNRKRAGFPGLPHMRKKRNKKKVAKAKPFAVRRHKEVVPIKETAYVMEYGLTWDQIYEISKNRFHIDRNPKVEVHVTKASDMRDEFSSYCGQKKTIKNWLFYIWEKPVSDFTGLWYEIARKFVKNFIKKYHTL